MGNCLGCEKKLGFWKGYSTMDGEWCKDCFPKRKEILEKLEKEQIENTSKIKKEELERKNKENEEKERQKRIVQEYKRKCNSCGKIWHSLKSEEDQLISGTKLNALVGLSTALTGNLGTSAQSNRNAQSNKDRLEDLRKCPECGSRNYSEELTEFEGI